MCDSNSSAKSTSWGADASHPVRFVCRNMRQPEGTHIEADELWHWMVHLTGKKVRIALVGDAVQIDRAVGVGMSLMGRDQYDG
jgi:hypothetical protein